MVEAPEWTVHFEHHCRCALEQGTSPQMASHGHVTIVVVCRIWPLDAKVTLQHG